MLWWLGKPIAGFQPAGLETVKTYRLYPATKEITLRPSNILVALGEPSSAKPRQTKAFPLKPLPWHHSCHQNSKRNG